MTRVPGMVVVTRLSRFELSMGKGKESGQLEDDPRISLLP